MTRNAADWSDYEKRQFWGYVWRGLLCFFAGWVAGAVTVGVAIQYAIALGCRGH